MITTLQLKFAKDGESLLFRINGSGPWRNEYNTDSLVPIGTWPVIYNYENIGTWEQGTLGHCRKFMIVDGNVTTEWDDRERMTCAGKELVIN